MSVCPPLLGLLPLPSHTVVPVATPQRICGGCRAEPDLSCPLTEGEHPLPALSGRLVPTTGAGLADE